MRSLLRWSALTLLGLAALVGGIVAVVLHIDPNRYRTDIVDLARDRAGLWLRIDGDLRWTLWPRLGLDIRNVTADWRVQPRDPLATFEHLAFDVQLLPLLRLQPALEVNGVRLDGAHITLRRHADGTGNWQRPARPSGPGGDQDQPAQPLPNRLRIIRSALTFIDEAAGTRDEVTELEVDLRDARRRDLGAKPRVARRAAPGRDAVPSAQAAVVERSPQSLAPLRASFRLARAGGTTAKVELAATAEIGATRVDLRGLHVTIDLLRVRAGPVLPIRWVGDVAYDFHGDRLDIPDATLSLAGAAMRLSVHDGHLSAPRHVPGRLSLPDQDITGLLAAFDVRPRSGPSHLALSSNFEVGPHGIAFTGLSANADASQMRGAVTLQTAPRMNVRFDLDAENLLLAGAPDGGSRRGAAEPPADLDAAIFPVPLLREIDWSGRLRARVVQYRTVRLAGVDASAVNREGDMRIDIAADDFLHGTLRGTLHVDARGSAPALDATIAARGVDSKMLPMQVMKKLDLDARLNIEGALHGAGNTRNQLGRTLTGAVHVDGGTGTLDTRTMKREAGNLVALASGLGLVGQSGVVSWPDVVHYRRLTGALQLNGLGRQKLGLELDNLHVAATGSYEPARQWADYVVTFKIGADPTYHTFDVAGFLRDVPWSMRCVGNVNARGRLCSLERSNARTALLALLSQKSAGRLARKAARALNTDAAGLRSLLEAFGRNHNHRDHGR